MKIEDLHDQLLENHFRQYFGDTVNKSPVLVDGIKVCEILNFDTVKAGLNLFVTKGMSGWLLWNHHLPVRLEFFWAVYGNEISEFKELISQVCGGCIRTNTPPLTYEKIEFCDFPSLFPNARASGVHVFLQQRLGASEYCFESAPLVNDGAPVRTLFAELTAFSPKEAEMLSRNQEGLLQKCRDNELADPAIIYRDFDFV